MRKLAIGDKVTCKTAVEAYYSNYGINPEQWFVPGMVGTVGAVNVPTVHGPRKSFTCVDFVGSNGKQWRCALYSENIRKVKEVTNHA